ncbi:MAG: A/G-specific adenine glycosylase [Planctomycetes bacterium]|nr:A/G-specific adenine glycosylase [Planctomycetota bacterium]
MEEGLPRRLRSRLGRWFLRNARDLPWRGERRDPWAVLVSEVMLQQTRVEVVAPRFEAFLARWPTPAAMAASPVDEVVAAWSGLGYYGRARRLHAAARAIVERHGGVFPAEEASLRALPGVGAYTAGAVGSLALGLPLPLVDGNVARVLARLFAVRGDPRRGEAARRIRDLAAELLPPAGAGAWNEGLMELGALVCVPGRPRCLLCPLSADCAGRAAGLEERLPETPPPRRGRAVRMAAALVRDGKGRTLLLRRPDGGLLGGTYELPSAEVGEGGDPVASLCDALHGRLGGRWEVGALRARVRHSILERRIALEAYEVRSSGRLRRPEDSLFAAPEDLVDLPLSSLVTKVLRHTEPDPGWRRNR